MVRAPWASNTLSSGRMALWGAWSNLLMVTLSSVKPLVLRSAWTIFWTASANSASLEFKSLNETLRWTRPTLAPFALARLFSLVPHLLPVVPIISVVTICARAFPVACLSRRSDHAILLAFHGNLYHDSAPTALH